MEEMLFINVVVRKTDTDSCVRIIKSGCLCNGSHGRSAGLSVLRKKTVFHVHINGVIRRDSDTRHPGSTEHIEPEGLVGRVGRMHGEEGNAQLGLVDFLDFNFLLDQGMTGIVEVEFEQ